LEHCEQLFKPFRTFYCFATIRDKTTRDGQQCLAPD
jgi:hypothetical protein